MGAPDREEAHVLAVLPRTGGDWQAARAGAVGRPVRHKTGG